MILLCFNHHPRPSWSRQRVDSPTAKISPQSLWNRDSTFLDDLIHHLASAFSSFSLVFCKIFLETAFNTDIRHEVRTLCTPRVFNLFSDLPHCLTELHCMLLQALPHSASDPPARAHPTHCLAPGLPGHRRCYSATEGRWNVGMGSFITRSTSTLPTSTSNSGLSSSFRFKLSHQLGWRELSEFCPVFRPHAIDLHSDIPSLPQLIHLAASSDLTIID